MSEFDVDAVVVGAGAVGLAAARRLALAGRSVVVLEREKRIGQGVSSRNSEVVHAGMYYPTGSLRARLCVAGRRLLYPFLAAHQVAYDKPGKLIVATDESELPALEKIERQAAVNGVEGMSRLTGAQARALEPELRAVAALLSAETGVFDSHGYMVALQGELERHGGSVALATPFEGASALPGGGWRVRAGGAEPVEVSARFLVIAAGLGCQAAAGAIAGFPARQNSAAALRQGQLFYDRRQSAVPTLDLSAADSRFAWHALSPRSRRAGAFRPGPRMGGTRELRSRSKTRRNFLRGGAEILARTARQCARAGLCRHPPENPRTRGIAAGFSYRWRR